MGPAGALLKKLQNHALMDAAVQRAVREAVLAHARSGHPVATCRDGRVVWLTPEEVFQALAEPPTGNSATPPGSGA